MYNFLQVRIWCIHSESWADIRLGQHLIQRVKVKCLSGRKPLCKKPGGLGPCVLRRG